MIWYVDIEHENALRDPRNIANFDHVRAVRTRVCGEAAGDLCMPIHYRELTPALARKNHIRAITISGNVTDWDAYDFREFEPLFELIQSGKMPTLAFCGGHQLLALMEGARCDAIRRLKPGEKDLGGFAPGWFKEVGFMPVQVIKDDPLFHNLGKAPVFFESHYWDIKDMPPSFELLASTEEVKIQVIKHRSHPVYGTQFHPEASNREHPDGFRLIENFFRTVGVRQG